MQCSLHRVNGERLAHGLMASPPLPLYPNPGWMRHTHPLPLPLRLSAASSRSPLHCTAQWPHFTILHSPILHLWLLHQWPYTSHDLAHPETSAEELVVMSPFPFGWDGNAREYLSTNQNERSSFVDERRVLLGFGRGYSSMNDERK